ncbi:hypothetical protein GF339_17120 [candidate division KSB3 bacterium]|uniref:Zinc/iron-chelating domain-containing protein n=1 Tax=candidate division KSB3 bacterium TaxID=2044937 RepID=A0A9D5Q6Z2_9BACT|nr:hypothetical protein [candidate division KSB3 bacterium]MBD3326310.1 hypothetical protein [candidate division KSB3 bacterium]
MKHANTWFAKLKRTLGAFFPVAATRRGHCVHCGACCRLPATCWFLKEREDGTSSCAIYPLRPLNCRKYPRTEGEWITQATCGFRFDSSPATDTPSTAEPSEAQPHHQ